MDFTFKIRYTVILFSKRYFLLAAVFMVHLSYYLQILKVGIDLRILRIVEL